jgi:hypothetical protein
VRAHLDRHAPRNLAHRRQQRQAPACVRHGLAGNRDGLRIDQCAGHLRLGREVQIGEQDLALLDQAELPGLGLLHLHDHLGIGEHRRGITGNLAAGLGIVRIGEVRAHAGPGLDEDRVAVMDEFAHRCRCQPDPVFAVLDLAGHADPHGHLPFTPPGRARRGFESPRPVYSVRTPAISEVWFAHA